MQEIWKQTACCLADMLSGTQPKEQLLVLAHAAGISVGTQLYAPCRIYTALGTDDDDGKTQATPLDKSASQEAADLLYKAAETYTSGEDMMHGAQQLKQYAVGADRASRCISLWDCWRMLTALACACDGREQQEKPMLLCALDFSGIQSYIYTISSSKDGDTNTPDILRGRSAALGILMEELVQEFVCSVGLDAVSIIYSGGGDAYLLLPNREDVVSGLREAAAHVNDWLIEQTGTALYLAYGAVACAPEELCQPNAYRSLFRTMTERIAHSKLNRYTPAQLIRLNKKHTEYRECRICHRPAAEQDTVCPACRELIHFSPYLVGKPCRVSVQSDKPEADTAYLTIPSIHGGDRYVVPDENSMRSYGGLFAAKQNTAEQNTAEQNTLDDLANASSGIPRIGVLRADVDNLGQTFISGFASLTEQHTINLLLMTSVLSRALTDYFSERLRMVFSKKTGRKPTHLPGSRCHEPDAPRIVTAIYSGGDDVFLIGAWDELLGAACDLAVDFHQYTNKKLSLSAGIGMYQASYPVFGFANETGDLESAAKEISDGRKNAMALFDTEHVMHWTEFQKQVLSKIRLLHDYFSSKSMKSNRDGAGTTFLFNLKTLVDELIEHPEKRIDLARLAFLLARMQPKKSSNEEEEAQYETFRSSIYKWVRDNGSQRQYLQTAVNLYLYLRREKKGGKKHGASGKNRPQQAE